MISPAVQAAADLAAFEEQKNPDLLEAAGEQLRKIERPPAPTPNPRTQRLETLELWLKLFALIDASLDPAFNPADPASMPLLRVLPPRQDDNVAYPVPVDPSMIKDPLARREYERRIAENEERRKRSYLQNGLRQIDMQFQSDVKDVIRNAYTKAPDDRRELEETIQRLISNPKRARRLRRMIAR